MAWKAQRLPSNGGKGSRNSCGLHPWYFKDLSSTVSFDCVPWNLFKKIKWATHKTATTHIRVVRSKVRSLQGPLESGSYDPLGTVIGSANPRPLQTYGFGKASETVNPETSRPKKLVHMTPKTRPIPHWTCVQDVFASSSSKVDRTCLALSAGPCCTCGLNRETIT